MFLFIYFNRTSLTKLLLVILNPFVKAVIKNIYWSESACVIVA